MSKAKSKNKLQVKPKSRPDLKPAALAVTPPPSLPIPQPSLPLRLDLGCGSNKRPGFFGVDQTMFPGVDLAFDLGDRAVTWPWPDASVTEVHCSHFLEHLSSDSRIHFMNELCRVLIPGGQALITVPYWASSRAYGDPSHQWPPIGEMTFFYYTKSWRLANAPHVDIAWNPLGFSCDLDTGAGYTLHPNVAPRTLEVQQDMVTFYKEAAQDITATLTKPHAPR